MSQFLIEQLEPTEPLVQTFRLRLSTRYNIGAFLPYLYMHAAPAGVFTFDILDEDDAVIFSQSFDCDDIKAALNTTDNYAHVFYPIIPVNPCQLDRGLYTARLSAGGGYTGVAGFIAWIKQHEDLNNILDYVPTTDLQNPLALRLKVFNQGITI